MNFTGPCADKRSLFWIGGLLLLLTVGCYWPVTTHGFISFDDPQYLSENVHLQPGLTWRGVIWAFTTGYASNWHPVTWLSHMLDVQLFGLRAGGHHFVGLLLHALNSVLLLTWLRQVTGSIWRSACVAALFALHPLHVESVAWASERKDLLSTCFFLLTLMAYTRYTQKPSARTYAIALVLFALGLMSKPMLVTLPCVLLLLDLWPLRRLVKSPEDFQSGRINLLSRQLARGVLQLALEKLPFVALAAVDSVITFCVQDSGGAMPSLHHVALGQRLANSIVSYCRYLLKTVWPTDLCIFYPMPAQWSATWVVGSALVIGGLSLLALGQIRRRPCLFVGWFWFLGTLVPTIGLVQVGAQSMADRYMYIPSIGLFMALVWGLAEVWQHRPQWRHRMGLAGAVALAACFYLTAVQVAYWQSPITVFARAVQVVPDNYLACNALGKAFEQAGQPEDAVAFYERALRLAPGFVEARYNLGTILLQQGKPEPAIEHLQKAVALEPGRADARFNLGTALQRVGRLDAAVEQLKLAVQLNPNDANTRHALAMALRQAGHVDEALGELQQAIRLNPAHAAARSELGILYATQSRFTEAITHFAEASRLTPQDAELRFNFGLACLNAGRPSEALLQFRAALNAGLKEPRIHYRLGQALTRTGNPVGAVAQFEEAIRLRPDFSEAREELAKLSRPPRFAAGGESAL